MRCKSYSVIFKSLLKFSGWEIGMAWDYIKRTGTSRKSSLFHNSYVYLPLGSLKLDKYIISLYHKIMILVSI